MSNEILRVGSLNSFPSENSPSLIKLAKYGFYYEGKGREVTCFSCGIKHEDWSYRSNPLEVHRQISPYCEYLKTLTPSDQPVFRPSIEIIENDCRHNATPRMPTTEIPYQNGIGTDSIHTCTDVHGTPMTVAVQSVDSGLFGSSLSHSSNNLVTSNSTSISSISQRSSRASTDSGFGSRGSISTDNSSSSNHNSNLAVPQLPPLLEGGEHSIQRVSGPASRDSPIPQNNRKNTPKEKYPEYIPIERRRATYKNWPPNLDFLHPLDLSECGFFYSNFGDCVRCFHCGIGLRNWESDDNPWVEHARWSRKCPYLLQRKGQEFIDSVLSVLGLQTDSEIEMQTANAGTEPASQVSSGYGTASANDVRDPICHPAAQYIIRENIFGDNKEKQVKQTMNQLLQNHEWDDITNDMLVNALLESKDIMENLDTKTNSLNLSESAVSKSDSNAQSTKPEDKNKEKETQKSGEEDPEKIQKENEELKDLYTCKICLDERVGITFVPCGHLVTCKDCSPKIRRCPLCRTFIRGTIKTTM
ncbi:baculoviral IAP repeat-containing protein 3-like isoform X2 [Mytilus galloprovincialis]